jgi:hypothetical protein
MNVGSQILVGAAAGVALWKLVIAPRSVMLETNPSRGRKKKFVRVRGHMRCMPKRRQKPEPEVVVVERIIERPVPMPSTPMQAASVVQPVVPVPPTMRFQTVVPQDAERPENEAEPTIEDMQEQNGGGDGFPWRVAIGAAAAGAAIAMVTSFAYQNAQRGVEQ